YIVSGLERSGTSMMMQLLYYGGAPVAFDRSREADEHNPRGYYELEEGKVISRLMDGSFPLEKFNDQFIKVTAYGLKFLPEGNHSYKVIYMLRDLDETLDSMEKMSGKVNRDEERPLLEKLNRISMNLMKRREDIEYLTVYYNKVIESPEEEIERINSFLGGLLDTRSAIKAVDSHLYRNRRL
ncbi:MAG: sulfotransferase domain-containing protein, partial [Halobacteriota archaeon]